MGGSSILRRGSGEPELRTSEERKRPMSRRAIAAALKKRQREEAVLAPQRPALDRTQFNAYLRDGSI